MTVIRNPKAAQRLYDGPAGDTPCHDEHIVLADGQKKVVEHAESENISMFTFNKEDHTLGNLISQRLRKRDHVKFAAYQVEHSHAYMFRLRVSTDGAESPKNAVAECCKHVLQDLEKLNNSFQKEVLAEKAVKESAIVTRSSNHTNSPSQPFHI